MADEDTFCRRDLLGFFDSLFAASVAFGLMTFYGEYKTLVASPPLSNFLIGPALPLLPMLTAIAYVLDDWRQARWLALDYGYRLHFDRPLLRFWLDCSMVVLSFFFVALAFSSPGWYLLSFAGYLALGWLWIDLLRRELRKWASDTSAYPPNSIGLSIETMPDVSPADMVRLDYRIGFINRTHGLAAVFVALCAVYTINDQRPGGGNDWLLSPMVQFMSTVVPPAMFVILKVLQSRDKRQWIAALEKSTEPT